MAECPKCRTKLVEQPSKRGLLYVCPGCNGRAMGIDALRKADVDTAFLTSIWSQAHEPTAPHHRSCPHCGRSMAAVDARFSNRLIYLDICAPCHSVWFDANEANELSCNPAPKPEKPLSDKAQQALLDAQLEANREIHAQKGDAPSSPLNHFLWVLGISPIETDEIKEKLPLLTWGLAALIGLLSVALLARLRSDIFELGFLPSVWANYGGLTIISSLFVHIKITHLIVNILVMLAIGDLLENALGWKKLLALFCISHLAGLTLYYFLLPNTPTPYFGASAAIAGLLTYQAVTSPHARYALFPAIAGHAIALRWHKMVVNSQALLVVYCVGQIITMSAWRIYMSQRMFARDWVLMSFMTIGGVVVGSFAGIWHRAVENEKRKQAPAVHKI
jgi:membrane associated rhomboid family serine protease/Zn-finger nucleic acid-binding protein